MAATPDDKKTTKTQWESHVWKTKTMRKLLAQSPDTIKLVPEDEQDYKITVHKELLCFYSPYFRAALKGEFSEAKRDELMIDASKDTLEMVLSWLYTGCLIPFAKGERMLSQYWEVFLFADIYECPALRRTVMTTIQKSCGSGRRVFFAYRTIRKVYSMTPENSAIRCYVSEFYANHWKPSKDNIELANGLADKYCYQDAPVDFFYDVMTLLSTLDKTKPPCLCCSDFCRYHNHESEEERLATCGKAQSKKRTIEAVD